MKKISVISALIAARLSNLDDLFSHPATQNPFHTSTRSHGGKHAASKRGHKHIHGMSRGQRKDAAKAARHETM